MAPKQKKIQRQPESSMKTCSIKLVTGRTMQLRALPGVISLGTANMEQTRHEEAGWRRAPHLVKAVLPPPDGQPMFLCPHGNRCFQARISQRSSVHAITDVSGLKLACSGTSKSISGLIDNGMVLFSNNEQTAKNK